MHEGEGNGPETRLAVDVLYDLVYLDDHNRESEVPGEDVRSVGRGRHKDNLLPRQESAAKRGERSEFPETKTDGGIGTVDGQVGVENDQ